MLRGAPKSRRRRRDFGAAGGEEVERSGSLVKAARKLASSRAPVNACEIGGGLSRDLVEGGADPFGHPPVVAEEALPGVVPGVAQPTRQLQERAAAAGEV